MSWGATIFRLYFHFALYTLATMKWATRAIILALTVLLASLGLADAAPGQDRRCKHKLQRKAW
jgi:hypothetical protein